MMKGLIQLNYYYYYYVARYFRGRESIWEFIFCSEFVKCVQNHLAFFLECVWTLK